MSFPLDLRPRYIPWFMTRNTQPEITSLTEDETAAVTAILYFGDAVFEKLEEGDHE